MQAVNGMMSCTCGSCSEHFLNAVPGVVANDSCEHLSTDLVTCLMSFPISGEKKKEISIKSLRHCHSSVTKYEASIVERSCCSCHAGGKHRNELIVNNTLRGPIQPVSFFGHDLYRSGN